jgi:hypothetical protein
MAKLMGLLIKSNLIGMVFGIKNEIEAITRCGKGDIEFIIHINFNLLI